MPGKVILGMSLYYTGASFVQNNWRNLYNRPCDLLVCEGYLRNGSRFHKFVTRYDCLRFRVNIIDDGVPFKLDASIETHLQKAKQIVRCPTPSTDTAKGCHFYPCRSRVTLNKTLTLVKRNRDIEKIFERIRSKIIIRARQIRA